ncbi:hypothetical protein [Halolamina salifodinae]|uniref:Uncharacterized protein n=1 Tax=Halolamina salifodinae TaxID=1202767 RepID=A0A8T4GXE5_9EURY|nr:hypothetical protein [Halolamina salifodinae]MBP1986294.1 hypothetical protein [Halolamina salifodinae]
MQTTGSQPARGMTLAALLVFLAVLAFYLTQPGYTQRRLVLFVALGTVATLGTIGAYTGRALVAAAGAVLLALLGFPQATLWIFVLPMAGVLAATALLIALDERTVERR